jgi:hypothetical protein
MYKIKNDSFRRKRGGNSKILDIYCSNCNNELLKYQKDGKGTLLRLYLNRILEPKNLEELQYKDFNKTKDISNLICNSCDNLIGVPMLYSDGRFAYRLIQGRFFKKYDKNQSIK